MSSAALKAVFAEMEAQDRAVNLLAELTPDLASLVALTVAKSEVKRWHEEELKMIQRRDRRPVYRVHSNEIGFLDAELSAIRSGCALDTHAETRLHTIMASLPVDAAARMSIIVAHWAVHRALGTGP